MARQVSIGSLPPSSAPPERRRRQTLASRLGQRLQGAQAVAVPVPAEGLIDPPFFLRPVAGEGHLSLRLIGCFRRTVRSRPSGVLHPDAPQLRELQQLPLDPLAHDEDAQFQAFFDIIPHLVEISVQCRGHRHHQYAAHMYSFPKREQAGPPPRRPCSFLCPID